MLTFDATVDATFVARNGLEARNSIRTHGVDFEGFSKANSDSKGLVDRVYVLLCHLAVC